MRTKNSQWISSPVFFGGGVLLLVLAVTFVFRVSLGRLVFGQTEVAEVPVVERDPMVVEISRSKAVAAGIHLGKVERRSLQALKTLPGQLAYDDSRRLVSTAPVDVVINKVLVEPREQVSAGTKLAVLSSAEIGVARNDYRRRQSDSAIAKAKAKRAAEIAVNVPKVVESLRKRPPWDEVEKQFSGMLLGDARNSLLGGYSRLLLAESAVLDKSLENQGAISPRLASERRSAREVMTASFDGLLETTLVDTQNERDILQADADEAVRLLHVSREKLSALFGPHVNIDVELNSESLNEFVLVASRGGRVEERHVVEASRVVAGQPLFTIADTSVLWVKALVHERDWKAALVSPGHKAQIRIPALDKSYETVIKFTSNRIDPETRAISVVAELGTATDEMRPGLFCWVDIPIGAAVDELAVPSKSISRNAGQTFVFIPAGESTFRRIDVELGLESNDWVGIRSGLSDNQPIVDGGVFALKSELLLERDE